MTPLAPGAAAPLLLRISLAKIHPSPDNPRKHFDEAFLAELGRSLKESGQYTPCIVRPHPKKAGEYELAAGESRLRAARLVKLDGLDCLVKWLDDAQFLELLTFENLKRRDLRPLEEARSYALLQKKLEGWTVERIAEKSGVSVDYVRDRMRLLTLVPEVSALVEQNRLPMSHALEIAKLSPEQQRTVVDPDEYDGVWSQDREPRDTLFDQDDESDEIEDEDEDDEDETRPARDPYLDLIPVSLRQLKENIATSFPVDLEAETTAELFPALVEAMEQAAEQAMPVVHITDAYSAPRAEDGAAPILSRREWRRADGSKGAKACKHATTLGVGVHGNVRGQAFTVCLAKTECRAHYAEEIKYEEERAAVKRANAEQPKGEDPWEKRMRLEREAKARFAVAQPAVLEALAKAVATASTKVGGPLDKLVARERPWPKATNGVGRGTTPEDLMRFLAWREFTANLYNAHEQLPKVGKMLGVDVPAIVKAAQPKKEKAVKKAPAKKSAKPAAKKGAR